MELLMPRSQQILEKDESKQKKNYTVTHCLSGSCTSHKYSQINYSEWRHLIVRERERDSTQNI